MTFSVQSMADVITSVLNNFREKKKSSRRFVKESERKSRET